MKAKTKMKTKAKTKMKIEMKIKTKTKMKKKMKAKTEIHFDSYFRFCFYFVFQFRFCFPFRFHFRFCFRFCFHICFCFYFIFRFFIDFFLVFIFKFYYGNSMPPYYFKANISFVFESCKWKTPTKIKNQGLQYSRLLLQLSGMKFTKNILDWFARSLQASILDLQREVGHLFPVWMTSYWLMLSEHVYNWSKFKVRSRDVFFS